MERPKLLYIALVVSLFVVSGCASMSEGSKKGAATGGLLGATAGAIIGHQSGSGIEGAAIGAAGGALAGAMIGDKMENARRNNPNHFAITEIVEYAQKGVPDDVIIQQIDRTQSKYYLTTETIVYLKNNNVSDKVINYMIATTQTN
jgi:uncharacterized protein YcfJ